MSAMLDQHAARVFVSYSYKDAAYLQATSLLGVLKGLESDGVEFWPDLKTAVGDRWDAEIRSRIEESQIALVLVSQAYLDSRYCADGEISAFLRKRRQDGMVVFPIILSPCEWERHDWLASTRVFPSADTTIEEDYSEHGRRERLFVEIRKQLRRQIDEVRRSRPRPATSWSDRFRALRTIPMAQRRPAAVAASRRLPVVGRDRELGLLDERWEVAQGGKGQLILLRGEAGIGKSRLTQAFTRSIPKRESHQQIYRGSADRTTSAFHPLVDGLHRALGLDRAETPAGKLALLDQALAEYDLPGDEMVPLLASFLSLPLGDRYAPLSFAPRRQREKTMEALLTWMAAISARRPLLLVVEDLHWLDPSTLDFLTLLVENLPTLPALAIFSFRPEFTPPWPWHSYVHRINLDPLPTEQIMPMVDRLAGGKRLPDEVTEQLVRKTAGIPLYVEELTKVVLESGLLAAHEDRWGWAGASPLVTRGDRGGIKYRFEGAGPVASLEIPATLQDAIRTRLDRLGAARRVAQLAATLGREFVCDLLREISCRSEKNLGRQLERLVEADLLVRCGLTRPTTYVFKHPLIRDVAYQSLPEKRRKKYHQRIARALKKKSPETAETCPELLARHYTEAGLYRQAVACWQRAGQRALERSANEEAIDHLGQGLELCDRLPDTRKVRRDRLRLRTTLAESLTATRGHDGAEVEKTYRRAEELCREVGEPQQMVQVLAGLWRHYLMRARLETARELAWELKALSEQTGDPLSCAVACRALSTTLVYCGEFPEALAHADQGIARWEAEGMVSDQRTGFWHPAVTFLSWGALALWNLGRAQAAQERSERAIRMAREVRHAHSLALALANDCLLRLLLPDGETALDRAEELVDLATEQGSFLLNAGILMRGRALYELRCRADGIRQMASGLAGWRDSGGRLLAPLWRYWLADGLGREGRSAPALELIEEGILAAQIHHEHWFLPELHRLRAQLLLDARQAADEAESSLRRAYRLARELGARYQELRAALGLARTWHGAGKPEAARHLLEESLTQ